MIKWKLVLLVILIITSFLTVTIELLKNCSDRSKTSAPDTPATAECPMASEHGKRAQVQKICFDCTCFSWLFLIFYIPFSVTTIMEQIIERTVEIKVAYGLHVNSFLNPFVYCWSIREIRRAVKNTLRRN